VSNVFAMIMLFFINAAAGGEVWFIYPWLGMMIGMGMHALTAWQGGMRLTDVFRSPSSLRAREVAAGPPDPAYDGEMRALGLVGADVLAGSHGGAVRRAVDDERAVAGILTALAPSDRAQLPDVEATLKSLVDRVATLAQALHRLDADIRPEQLAQVQARLADARALPEGSSERERRVVLLERQQTTLSELAERRTTLAAQLDSASLVLHTMRLDLLRLRSAGIASSVADVNTATQEARALSSDIGRVLDAAAEVRKLN
jgi:hypothetical protein